MEKLQEALRKARALRDRAGAAVPGPSTGSGPGSAADPDHDAAWAALTAAEPDPAHLMRNRVLTLKAGRTATAFDVLRTKVFLTMQRNGWTRLAVTSPTGSCGKSTLSANLAAGFTRQPDIRAALIELDLRRPSLARIFGLMPERDVSALLSGGVPFAEQALRLRDNVALALARRPAPDPTSLLLSRRTQEILSGIEMLYSPEIVIFDLPPILAGDDTRAFLGDVDAALIVARAERTTKAEISACEREIAELTNVMGVVLNQCRIQDRETAYGSDYGSY
jgi:protein-tyrosine kinase